MFTSIVPDGKRQNRTDLLRVEPFSIEVPEGSMYVNPDGAETRYLRAAEVITGSFVPDIIFYLFFTNFRRLVLGCMDTSDSESRHIFQHFSRSAQFLQ